MKSVTPSVSLTCVLAIVVVASGALAGERPLARVDGQPLSGDDLERSFASRHSGHTGFLGGEVETRRALDHLVDRTLLVQEAERLELDRRPEILEALDGLATKLAVEHLLEVDVNRPSRPTDEELRQSYERFTDHLLKVRQIVVPTRADAEEVESLLDAGTSFEDLVRERSRGRSAQADGLLPPIGWGTMSADWDAVAFALEPGEVSRPIRADEGWEIVRLEERLPVERPEFGEAAGRINAILTRRKLEAAERAFVDGLHRKYEVTVELVPDSLAAYREALDRDPQTVVARWNGGELRVGELAGVVNLRDDGALSPDRAAANLALAVRNAVAARLARREATERGYDELPEVRARVREQRETAMLAVLYEEFIFRDVAVTDEDVREWYESNPDELRTPERRLVAQILVGSREEALAAAARLAEGAAFEELVAEVSIASDAARGGVLGWVRQADSPPGFEEVFTLDAGQVSRPIQSEYGWHLIRVADIEPPRVPPFEEVADIARERAGRERRQQARRDWLVQLRDNAEIKYYASAIRRFARDRAPDRDAPVPDHGAR